MASAGAVPSRPAEWLAECLPVELRGPGTTITSIVQGFSGAGVYRVESADRAHVLKIAGADVTPEGWRARHRMQRLAFDAGLTPRIVHVDEARRAVVSEFVVDRSFPHRWGDPATRDVALVELAATLRRVHALPLPDDAAVDGRTFLATRWAALGAPFALPAFVDRAVRRLLDDEPPPPTRAPVLSHNDVHPFNMVYDGARLLLLDWDVAGPNDPFYDLATISVFFRMSADECARLVAAYDAAPVTALPERFLFERRLGAALCGVSFLGAARAAGHPGITADQRVDATPGLGAFYQKLRAGAIGLDTADGLWAFGLALVAEGTAL